VPVLDSSVSDFDFSDQAPRATLGAMSLPTDLCLRTGDPGADPRGRRTLPSVPRVRALLLGSEMVSEVWDGRTLTNTFWRAYIVDRPGLALTDQDGTRHDYPINGTLIIPAWCPFIFHSNPAVGHAFIHFITPEIPAGLVQRWWPRPFSLDDPWLLNGIRELAGRLMSEQPPDIDTHIHALATQAFARCLDALPRGEFNPQHGRLQPALDLINTRLEQTIAVSDLAKALGVGAEHCIRLFKRHLGQTPMQYLIDQRLQRASELLSNPQLSISEVARRCGFPNRSYFSRVFARRLGIGPATYRQ
jgi:AraC-like DNA-binding protein